MKANGRRSGAGNSANGKRAKGPRALDQVKQRVRGKNGQTEETKTAPHQPDSKSSIAQKFTRPRAEEKGGGKKAPVPPPAKANRLPGVKHVQVSGGVGKTTAGALPGKTASNTGRLLPAYTKPTSWNPSRPPGLPGLVKDSKDTDTERKPRSGFRQDDLIPDDTEPAGIEKKAPTYPGGIRRANLGRKGNEGTPEIVRSLPGLVGRNFQKEGGIDKKEALEDIETLEEYTEIPDETPGGPHGGELASNQTQNHDLTLETLQEPIETSGTGLERITEAIGDTACSSQNSIGAPDSAVLTVPVSKETLLPDLLRPRKTFDPAFIPVRHCDNCPFSLNNQCPKFNPGHECAFLPVIGQWKLESVSDIKEAFVALCELDVQRFQQAYIDEKLRGGAVREDTSESLQQAKASLKDAYSFALGTERGNNTGNNSGPGPGSVIMQIFGNLPGQSSVIEQAQVADPGSRPRYQTEVADAGSRPAPALPAPKKAQDTAQERLSAIFEGEAEDQEAEEVLVEEEEGSGGEPGLLHSILSPGAKINQQGNPDDLFRLSDSIATEQNRIAEDEVQFAAAAEKTAAGIIKMMKKGPDMEISMGQIVKQ